MKELREFYASNPHMVSSPFGGVHDWNEPLFADVLARLDIELAQHEGARILDVGCGRGFAGDFVRRKGCAYVGVDLVPRPGDFPLASAEALHLPFPDASFQGLFCIDVFEHIEDYHGAAAEFRRVLQPDGWVFLSTPNYGNVAGAVKWWAEHFGKYEKNSWAPFGRWQAQEWETPLTLRRVRRAFKSAGFRSARLIGYGPEVGLGLVPWMEHPRTPEAIRFRLQRLFRIAGPGIVRIWPGASLHGFWKFGNE